jgi:hypothetical protein
MAISLSRYPLGVPTVVHRGAGPGKVRRSSPERVGRLNAPARCVDDPDVTTGTVPAEARETSGAVTGTLLRYVRTRAGDEAVTEVLRRADAAMYEEKHRQGDAAR